MKNKTTAGLLALFLGGLGIHKFYLGYTLEGFIYLLFSWTFIPAILGVFTAISIFTHTDKRRNDKYNGGKNPAGRDKYDELLRLHDLKAKKIITKEKYNEMKEKIEKEQG